MEHRDLNLSFKRQAVIVNPQVTKIGLQGRTIMLETDRITVQIIVVQHFYVNCSLSYKGTARDLINLAKDPNYGAYFNLVTRKKTYAIACSDLAILVAPEKALHNSRLRLKKQAARKMRQAERLMKMSDES